MDPDYSSINSTLPKQKAATVDPDGSSSTSSSISNSSVHNTRKPLWTQTMLIVTTLSDGRPKECDCRALPYPPFSASPCPPFPASPCPFSCVSMSISLRHHVQSLASPCAFSYVTMSFFLRHVPLSWVTMFSLRHRVLFLRRPYSWVTPYHHLWCSDFFLPIC